MEEFDCSKCSKSFEFFFQRKEHLRDEHGIWHPPPANEHTCPMCGHPFGTSMDRTVHIREDHTKEKYQRCMNLMHGQFQR